MKLSSTVRVLFSFLVPCVLCLFQAAASSQSPEVNHARTAFYDLDDDPTAIAQAALDHPADTELTHWALALSGLDKIHATYLKVLEYDPHGAWTLLARARYASPWERRVLARQGDQGGA